MASGRHSRRQSDYSGDDGQDSMSSSSRPTSAPPSSQALAGGVAIGITALIAIICSLVYILRRKRRALDAAAEPSGAEDSHSPVAAPTGNINASSYRRGPRRTGRPGSGSSIHAHIPLDRLRGRPFRVRSPPPPPPPYVPGIVLPAYTAQQQSQPPVDTIAESGSTPTPALPTALRPGEEAATGNEDQAEAGSVLHPPTPHASSAAATISVSGSRGSVDAGSTAPIIAAHPDSPIPSVPELANGPPTSTSVDITRPLSD